MILERCLNRAKYDKMMEERRAREDAQKEEEPACAEHDQTASELSGESVYTINKSITRS